MHLPHLKKIFVKHVEVLGVDPYGMSKSLMMINGIKNGTSIILDGYTHVLDHRYYINGFLDIIKRPPKLTFPNGFLIYLYDHEKKLSYKYDNPFIVNYDLYYRNIINEECLSKN